MSNNRKRLCVWMVVVFAGPAFHVCAQSLPIHIKPFLDDEYDSIVWGCRFVHCVHTYHEEKQTWRTEALQKGPAADYLAWYEACGKQLEADWRAGRPISSADARYLPLAKTAFWNSVIKGWDGSRGYFRFRELPDISRFPAKEQAPLSFEGLTTTTSSLISRSQSLPKASTPQRCRVPR